MSLFRDDKHEVWSARVGAKRLRGLALDVPRQVAHKIALGLAADVWRRKQVTESVTLLYNAHQLVYLALNSLRAKRLCGVVPGDETDRVLVEACNVLHFRWYRADTDLNSEYLARVAAWKARQKFHNDRTALCLVENPNVNQE